MINTNLSLTPLQGLPTTPQKAAPTAPVAQEPALPQDGVQLSALPAVEKKPLREATGEMAEMVESMLAAEEQLRLDAKAELSTVIAREQRQSEQAKVPIAMLDFGSAPEVPVYNSNIDGFLAKLAKDAQEAEGGHGPKGKEKHGLLGGHLGIEGAEHAAHDLLAAKTHAAGQVLSAKGEAVQEALNLTVSGKQATSEVHNQVVSHGSEAAGHAMSGLAAGLTGALAAGSGALGAVLLHTGVKTMKEGIQHKDAEHAIEGLNSTLVGTRSVAAGVNMAGHLIHGSEIVTTVASAAKSVLTPLGVVHGAIDVGLGANQVIKGIKAKDGAKITKGALGMGLGGALIAAAAGGGIPAIVAAGVFLTGKIVHSVRQARKQAASGEATPEH